MSSHAQRGHRANTNSKRNERPKPKRQPRVNSETVDAKRHPYRKDAVIDEHSSVLPSDHLIDYGAVLPAAEEHREADLAHFLRAELPFRWRDGYAGTGK